MPEGVAVGDLRHDGPPSPARTTPEPISIPPVQASMISDIHRPSTYLRAR